MKYIEEYKSLFKDDLWRNKNDIKLLLKEYLSQEIPSDIVSAELEYNNFPINEFYLSSVMFDEDRSEPFDSNTLKSYLKVLTFEKHFKNTRVDEIICYYFDKWNEDSEDKDYEIVSEYSTALISVFLVEIVQELINEGLKVNIALFYLGHDCSLALDLITGEKVNLDDFY